MAGSVNKVILVGNLGRDPEVRVTQDGKEIANLVLATSDTWRDKQTGEKKEKTEWHRVVVFNDGLVNIIKQYIKKGAKLYVEGALQTRKWVDNQGVERYSTEVVLQGFNSSLTILDSRGSGGGNAIQGNADSYQQHDETPAFGQTTGTFSVSSSSGSRSTASASTSSNDLDDEIPF